MIAALLLWLYLSALAFVIGRATLRAALLLSRRPWAGDAGLAATTLLGFGVLATLCAWLGHLIPIAGAAHAAVLALALACALLDRRGLRAALSGAAGEWRRTPPAILLLALALGAVLLAASTRRADLWDTGLYHAQAIRWRQEVGVVAGLGNLHAPLALTYPWFALSAFGGVTFLGLSGSHVLLGVLMLVFALFALGRLRGLATSPAPSQLTALACAALGLHAFGGWIPSTSSDAPSALLAWTGAILALEALERGSASVPDAEGIAALLLLLQAPTLKLAYAPAVLGALALAFAWSRSGARRAVLVALLAGAVVMLPLVGQMAVETGYLLHPFPTLDVLDVDWKMPRDAVARQQDWIHGWARMPGLSGPAASRQPISVWLPHWWQAMVPLDKALVALGLLPLLLALAKLRRRPDPPFSVAAFSSLVLLFWFLTAPDPRFARGTLIFQGAVLLAPYALPLARRLGPRLIAAAWLLALVAQTPGLVRASPQQLAQRLVLPEADPVPETRLVQARGFAVHVPVVSRQCWYAPFPCTPQHVSRTEARGPSLADGFRAARADPR